MIALSTLFTGPMPAVSVQLPEQIALGAEFPLTLDVSNPHGEDVVLDNVDIPDRVFERFEVAAVSPVASNDSPVGGLGTQAWFFDREIRPGHSFRITMGLKALQTGVHPVESDVCNSYEDCTTFVGVIEVVDPEG